MDLIGAILSLCGILISAVSGTLLGAWLQQRKDQHEKKQQRYDHLYAPFVKLLLKETHGAFLFTELPETLQQRFIDILFMNYEYSDTDLQKLIYLFQSAYDNRHTYGDDDVNQYFFDIENDISSTYHLLNKALYYESRNLKRKKKRITRKRTKHIHL